MFYTIYRITNQLDGKIYIGKHQTKDLNDGYMGSGKFLKRAIKKHGKENFTKEILFVFDTEAEMNAKEAELVDEKFCLREDTYNLCSGGQGGFGYINNNGELVGKRDRREYKILGRIAANEKIKERYGSLSNQSKIAGSFGGKSFSQKFKTDENFKQNALENLKKCRAKAQTLESAAKRKKTMANNKQSQGQKNSQYGKRWIFSHFEKKNAKIGKLDPLPDGWVEGRKMIFD